MKEIKINEFESLVGETFEPSPWRTITQEMINSYGVLVDDEQWIHCDIEKAANESPFKTTIAHGLLSASYVPRFIFETLRFADSKMSVNYGMDKLRFPHHVPVNSRIRGRTSIIKVDDYPNNGKKVTFRVTVEIEGFEKPACVADIVLITW